MRRTKRNQIARHSLVVERLPLARYCAFYGKRLPEVSASWLQTGLLIAIAACYPLVPCKKEYVDTNVVRFVRSLLLQVAEWQWVVGQHADAAYLYVLAVGVQCVCVCVCVCVCGGGWVVCAKGVRSSPAQPGFLLHPPPRLWVVCLSLPVSVCVCVCACLCLSV